MTASNSSAAVSDPEYLVTCPKGIEHVLAKELIALGAPSVKETVAGVYFYAPLDIAYRVCVQSRVANKVIRVLHRGEMQQTEDFIQQANAIDWPRWFTAERYYRVDFNGSNASIRDVRYGAQLCKDAVSDCFSGRGLSKPKVDVESPEVVVHVRLFKHKLVIGLDMVGESLHRRGYRDEGGKAPLKENLAAALLFIADWPAKVERGECFVDPMCGSGTLLIEAAMMAKDIPPSILRRAWALECLSDYDAKAWYAVLDQAEETMRSNQTNCQFIGFDIDDRALQAARSNISAIGLSEFIQVQRVDIAQLNLAEQLNKSAKTGLVLVNPPYGVRLGDEDNLRALYRDLGRFLQRQCVGWDAAIFTGNPDLGWSTGLRSWRQHKLFNGGIESQLQRYRVSESNQIAGTPPSAQVTSAQALGEHAQALLNRLQKNRKKLAKWLRSNELSCFRLYDADLPEYAVAIDCYLEQSDTPQAGDTKTWFHVQEYAAPKTIDASLAKKHIDEVVKALSAAEQCERGRIVIKRRERQRGQQQYQPLDNTAPFFNVREHGLTFKVNLGRYLDTGLFLDFRGVRALLQREAAGKRFLNLFAYTSTATVYAAKGGASHSVSVDMSQTYIDWSADNFALNQIDRRRHQLVNADCLDWLQQHQEYYDIILLDPPSFSNSKKMSQTLDIQRDHQAIIELAVARLAPAGRLYFSTNKRGFRMSDLVAAEYSVKEITSATQSADFQRAKAAHRCWQITKQPDEF